MAFEEDADEFGAVTLRLGEDELQIASEYEYQRAIFDQPGSFAFRAGDGSTAASLIKKYPPRTPFQVLINDIPQMSGYTTAFDASTEENSGAEVQFSGRCILNEPRLHKIERDESFNGATQRQLIEKVIEVCDLVRPFSTEPVRILTSNRANRSLMTSGNTIAEVEDRDVVAQLSKLGGAVGGPYPVVRSRAGETALSLLRRHLDNVGLFIWSSAGGNIVVGVPATTGQPLYRIERRRGVRSSPIVGSRYGEDHDHRFTEVAVYGWSHSRKHARFQVKGGFTDPEFFALGYNRPEVVTDAQAHSIEHAEHIAAVHLASGRRASWKLSYTLKGHVTVDLSGKTVVWAPDTLVSVYDEEFGLNEVFYIEAVRGMRQGKTTTTITLQRPVDMIFGLGQVSQ